MSMITQTRPLYHRRVSLVSMVATLADVYRSRRALRVLTPEQLADIGVTRAQADRESHRAAWDVPDHWLSGR